MNVATELDPFQPTLTFHMEGLARDGGDLKLGLFIDKLASLKAALQETDRLLSGTGKQTVEFLVSDLKHNSPAAVTLKALATSDSDPNANQDRLFPYFADLLVQVTSGTQTQPIRPALLEKLDALCNGIGSRFSRMWLSQGDAMAASFDERTKENIRAMLSKTSAAFGSVKGKVERFNSHGEQKSFHVYPMLGNMVKCLFDEDLLADASAAVEKSVTVFGRLKYREGQLFPYEMQVTEILLHGDDSGLASLSGLVGLAKDASEQSATDFIRESRDGWH